MKRRVLWGGAALVLVAVVAGGMVVRSRSDRGVEVQTDKARKQEIIQKVTATGKIEPRTQVKISADVSAKITRLAVAEGQWVEKGAPLVELDRARYLAAVESSEANVRSAQANAELVRQNMEQTQKDLTRAQEMRASGLESQSGVDTKQTAYQVEAARYQATLAQVEQARAALKQAKDDLSKTSIYAPMAGTVSELNKKVGEIALGSQFQADVILVVADLSEMEAQVDVDENDITSIAVGQSAEIQVDALPNQTLKGTVREIGSSAKGSGSGTSDQKTEFEIKIAIASPPPTLRPGMTASADIVTKSNPSALSVPLQCVALRTIDQLAMKGEKRKDVESHFKPDKDGFVEVVFCVEKGRAVARQVKSGIQSDERIEILDGLADGDEVVSGSYRAISKDLVNGAVVKVDNSKKPEKSKKGEAQG
jgi:HlyD family secretion protein